MDKQLYDDILKEVFSKNQDDDSLDFENKYQPILSKVRELLYHLIEVRTSKIAFIRDYDWKFSKVTNLVFDSDRRLDEFKGTAIKNTDMELFRKAIPYEREELYHPKNYFQLLKDLLSEISFTKFEKEDIIMLMEDFEGEYGSILEYFRSVAMYISDLIEEELEIDQSRYIGNPEVIFKMFHIITDDHEYMLDFMATPVTPDDMDMLGEFGNLNNFNYLEWMVAIYSSYHQYLED